MSFWFFLKIYLLAGFIFACIDLYRPINSLNKSIIHPYGTSWWQQIKTTLSLFNWIVLPLYLTIYMIFWPWTLNDERRWRP